MATIKIEDFDHRLHPNPMRYIDDEQSKRHGRAPSLMPYKVCSVVVCGFRFVSVATRPLAFAAERQYR